MNENMGLIGRKIGMTQIFADDGAVSAVTVIEAGPNMVLQVKTSDTADGYNAIQLGFEAKDKKKLSKAIKGHLEKVACKPVEAIREIRLPADAISKFEPGQALGPGDVFAEGDFCDVIGTSKGSGFSGVMKKFNFRGAIRSHGVHEFFRHGGSIGTRLTPGHVFKGKKMPGQLGNARITVQNMKVAKVDAERNLVYIRGGVPGPNGGIVLVRKASKKG